VTFKRQKCLNKEKEYLNTLLMLLQIVPPASGKQSHKNCTASTSSHLTTRTAHIHGQKNTEKQAPNKRQSSMNHQSKVEHDWSLQSVDTEVGRSGLSARAAYVLVMWK
jgi:hypothetical protein